MQAKNAKLKGSNPRALMYYNKTSRQAKPQMPFGYSVLHKKPFKPNSGIVSNRNSDVEARRHGLIMDNHRPEYTGPGVVSPFDKSTVDAIRRSMERAKAHNLRKSDLVHMVLAEQKSRMLHNNRVIASKTPAGSEKDLKNAKKLALNDWSNMDVADLFQLPSFEEFAALKERTNMRAFYKAAFDMWPSIKREARAARVIQRFVLRRKQWFIERMYGELQEREEKPVDAGKLDPYDANEDDNLDPARQKLDDKQATEYEKNLKELLSGDKKKAMEMIVRLQRNFR